MAPPPIPLVLSPALAAAKARGVRRQACAAPPRPAWAPVPAAPEACELAALLTQAAARRGVLRGVDFRLYASCRAVLAAVRWQAGAAGKGRRPGAAVRTSWAMLARLVDGLMGWERGPDRLEDGARRRSSLRRWVRELQTAGLLEVAVVVDDEGQERGMDLTLLEVPAGLPLEDLQEAERRLARWRTRYGNGPELVARRSGAILGRLERRRRETQARWARPSRRPADRPSRGVSNGFAPPLTGASGVCPSPADACSPWEASCGASARADAHTRTRPKRSTTDSSALTRSAVDDPAGWSEGADPFPGLLERIEAARPRVEAKEARWASQLARAVATCEAHAPTAAAPLPAIAVLRQALAQGRQTPAALAGGEPVAGLGARLLRRLQLAAARWLEYAPSGAPTPAVELLRRARARPGDNLGEVIRGFAAAARGHQLAARAARGRRLEAAAARARRNAEGILAAWPSWLRREGDDLVLDAGDRYVQVDRLPPASMLDSTELRRWLRDVTALRWGRPASALELTDRDGRYAFVPLDGARLQRHGERTRSAWTSSRPRRQQARSAAAHRRAGTH